MWAAREVVIADASTAWEDLGLSADTALFGSSPGCAACAELDSVGSAVAPALRAETLRIRQPLGWGAAIDLNQFEISTVPRLRLFV